jgi:lipopolysaccharide biosynthesis glycosyltransferase
MPLMNDPVHVAAACDENYAMPLAAMLASIGASLSEQRRVVVHVLESGLVDQTRLRIERRLDPKLQLNWIPIDVSRLSSLQATLRRFDTVSLQSYYRLLLPEVLSSQLQKVIYLDCDLVVNHDLSELWDLDVSSTCLLAVPELIAGSRFVSSRAGIRLYRELGLPADLRIFNSGVMVLNLQKWRALRIAQRALVYLREAGPYLQWHDQEAINAIAAGDWRALDPRWNVTMHAFRGTSDRAKHAAAINDSFILHYNSAIKPWHLNFRFSGAKLFFHHIDRTDWTGWRPMPPTHRHVRRWIARIVRAVRKRNHIVGRKLLRLRRSLRRSSVLRIPLTNLHGRRVPATNQVELRVLIVAEHVDRHLRWLVEYCFTVGADRVLIVLEHPEMGDVEALQRGREKLHLFTPGVLRRTRHELLRHLLHRYGRGHWCLMADTNELLVYPNAHVWSLKQLCDDLEASGYDALDCQVVQIAAADDWTAGSLDEIGPAIALRIQPAPTLERLKVVLSDSLDGRVFTAAVCANLAGPRIEQLELKSRVPLLRYRSAMSIAADVRAVYPARPAEFEGVVLCRTSCNRQA